MLRSLVYKQDSRLSALNYSVLKLFNVVTKRHESRWPSGNTRQWPVLIRLTSFEVGEILASVSS